MAMSLEIFIFFTLKMYRRVNYNYNPEIAEERQSQWYCLLSVLSTVTDSGNSFRYHTHAMANGNGVNIDAWHYVNTGTMSGPTKMSNPKSISHYNTAD